MVRTACLTAAAAVGLGISLAAQPPSLTIDQAVRLALAHNLGLAAERDNVAVAEAAIATASLRPNPVVTASLTRPDRPLVDAGVSPYEQIFRTDYVIEGGGKRERRVAQASLAKSVAEFQLRNTTRLLVLDVQRAFTDVQVARANLALAQDALRAFDDIVAVNVERVRAGDLPQVELSRSRLAALQFENDVREHRTKLREASNHLSVLIGRPPDGTVLETAGDFRRDSREVDYATLLHGAVEARPDVQALRSEQGRSAADLRLQMANGRIDYTVSGEYHRQESSALGGNSYLLSVSVPLPIFNRNQGEVARARTQQRQAATKLRALEQQVGEEAAAAYADYTLARDSLATIETRMLADARAVRQTTEYAYRRGDASLIELLDAQRAFDDTMRSYNEARAQYARSLYTLDALVNGDIQP